MSSHHGLKRKYPMRQQQRRREVQQHLIRYRLTLSYLTVLCVICWIPPLYANPSGSGSSSNSNSSTNPTFHRRQPQLLQRKLQSWMIRHPSNTKFMNRVNSRSRYMPSPYHSRGSILTFHRPTREKIFQWFGIEGEDPNHILRCMMVRKEYNHHLVGITNPFLHVANSHSGIGCHELDMSLHGSWSSGSSNSPYPVVTNNQETVPVSRVRTVDMYSWWPPLQTSVNEKQRNGKSERKNTRKLLPFRKHREEDWRILIYRKSVGNGKACYERVRDAALDWDFQSDDGCMGIIEVPVTSPNGGNSRWGQLKSSMNGRVPVPYLGAAARRYSVRPVIEEDDTIPNSDNNSGVYRSLGPSSRRFVTYTTSKLMAAFRRQLYAVNPVMVVYDLVDQRAPGTTFTSTAYATLKGHWLRGEERVTVALRDGSNEVDVEILSISRAGPSLWGKTLWPFVGNMQTKFFEQHLDHLARTGAAVMNSSCDDKSIALPSAVYVTAPSSTTTVGCDTPVKSCRRPLGPLSSVHEDTILFQEAGY
jgi:uncharacterized protein (UPF0548 family)